MVKKVLAFGTFDIFHKGHEFYLTESKKHGDKLYVIIARDSTVEKVKGILPRNNQEKRMRIISEFEVVDEVLLGRTNDKYGLIEEVNPDVICLGYDQVIFTEKLEQELKKRKITAEIVRINSFEPNKYKSSLL